MPFQIFTIPVRDSGPIEQELNSFLAQHKVVSLERQLIDEGVNSFWAICVDYLGDGSDSTTAKSNLSRNRIDYKQVLPPDEFAVFSKLRDLRKELALQEAVLSNWALIYAASCCA